MNSHIITFDQLKESTGRKAPAEVAAWLASNGVPYFTGAHNRPWTTLQALNAALGLHEQQPTKSNIEVL